MNPDLFTSTEHTPLHYAASLGHTQMCLALLDHGADINAQTDREDTPLTVALLQQNETYKAFLNYATVNFHIQNNQKNNALHIAVSLGDVAAVQSLLPHFDDDKETINLRNYRGQTAIHLAAQLDSHGDAVKLVNALLQSKFIDPGLKREYVKNLMLK